MTLLLTYRAEPRLLLPYLGPRREAAPTAAEPASVPTSASSAPATPPAAAPATPPAATPPAVPTSASSAAPLRTAPEPPSRPLRPQPEPEPPRPQSDWEYNGPPMDAPAPRAAEIKLDPRTVYKQRGSTRPALPKISAVPVEPRAKCDMIIVPQAPTFRVVEQGLKSVVTYLRTTQILTATYQKVHPDGAIQIAMLPDAFVHLVLLEGSAPSGPPCVAEGSLWSTPKPRAIPFGPAREACLWLELIGVRAETLVEGFLPKLHGLLYLRPELHVVPHDPRRLRQSSPLIAAEPIPRFDVEEK